MLVFTRKNGESFKIGNDVVVTIVEIRGNKCVVGVEAPKDVKVLRAELEERDVT